MREIKFRAWNKNNKNMQYGNFGLFMFVGTGVLGWQVGDSYEIGVDNEFVLMQYTGLCDKNGIEIYEGDIVKVYSELRIVEFKNAFWQLELRQANTLGGFGTPTQSGHKPLYRYPQDWIEIIGNIYEHPELLTQPQTA